MTKDTRNKIIGILLILLGISLFAYLIISTKKSIILSAVAGLLFGIGYKTMRLNKNKEDVKGDTA